MSCDPFLMKKLLKKEVCGSRELFTGPTKQPKTCLKKKKNADVVLNIGKNFNI